jgi:hypothetical protein
MKRKLNLTEDFDSCKAIVKLTDFLDDLKIKAAFVAMSLADDALSENFCSDCENDKEYCQCDVREHSGRYMREYDDGASLED